MCDDGAPIWVKCRPRREDQVKNSAILLLKCSDRKGLDAAIADFIYWHGGGIFDFFGHQAGGKRFCLWLWGSGSSGCFITLKRFPSPFKPSRAGFSLPLSLRVFPLVP